MGMTTNQNPDNNYCTVCDGWTEVRDGRCVMCDEIVIDTNQYGYIETGKGVECTFCGQTFDKRPGGFGVEGSIQRSHAKRCPVNPRDYHVPARCFA